MRHTRIAMIATVALAVTLLSGCASEVEKADAAIADTSKAMLSAQKHSEEVRADTEPSMKPADAAYEKSAGEAEAARVEATDVASATEAEATASAEAIQETSIAAITVTRNQEDADLTAALKGYMDDSWARLAAEKVGVRASDWPPLEAPFDVARAAETASNKVKQDDSKAAFALASAATETTLAEATTAADKAKMAAETVAESTYDAAVADAEKLRDATNADWIKEQETADKSYRDAQTKYQVAQDARAAIKSS